MRGRCEVFPRGALNSSREFMSVPLFVVLEIGHTLVNGDTWMPTATIDVSKSPAVADLARVHAMEGIGDVSTYAIRQDDAVVIGVHLTSPVQAVFAVAFSYVQHREFLEEVANASALVFATTDVQTAHKDRPMWLSVNIDGEALLQTISN